MKKSKYGEDTVVIRVPASRKEEVLKYIQGFSVVTDMASYKEKSGTTQLADACSKSYSQGFSDGEKFQFLQSYAFCDSDEEIKTAVDLWENRVPESCQLAVLEKIGSSLIHSKVNLPDKVFSLSGLIKNAVLAIENNQGIKTLC